MSSSDISSSAVDASGCAYVVGIVIGSQSCDFCVLKPDKRKAPQIDEVCQCASWVRAVAEPLRAAWRARRAHPHWPGSHLPLRGEPLSFSGGPGLLGVLAPSSPNPPVCAATGLAGKNRPH